MEFIARKVVISQLVAGILALAAFTHSAEAAKRVVAPERYETRLGPTPVPDGAPSPIAGGGTVRAALEGQMLQIDGQFMLKDAAATGVRLMQGAGIGMPGAVIAANVPVIGDGTMHATVKLARDQLAALRGGRLYILVLSSKSPAPAGHLWGWLLPAQPAVAEGQSQLGDWYLPQGAGLKARPAARGSR